MKIYYDEDDFTFGSFASASDVIFQSSFSYSLSFKIYPSSTFPFLS